MVVVSPLWQIRTPEFPTHELDVIYDSNDTLFTLKIHHNGLFTNPPNRKYRFGHIAYVALIDVDYFRIQEYVGMLDALGLGDSTLFSHFRILGKSLDDGLVPLMSVEDVVQMFKYVPRFKEIEVCIEEGILSVKEHLLYMRNSRGKGVLIEDIEDDDVVKESEKAGELCLLEWHGATEIGNEGKQGDTSTHVSSSKACKM